MLLKIFHINEYFHRFPRSFFLNFRTILNHKTESTCPPEKIFYFMENSGRDAEQVNLNLQINSKSVCGPLFISIFDPRLPSKIFCAVRNLQYMLQKEKKHSDTTEDDRLNVL